jgi:hypothetical protein
MRFFAWNARALNVGLSDAFRLILLLAADDFFALWFFDCHADG